MAQRKVTQSRPKKNPEQNQEPQQERTVCLTADEVYRLRKVYFGLSIAVRLLDDAETQMHTTEIADLLAPIAGQLDKYLNDIEERERAELVEARMNALTEKLRVSRKGGAQ